MATTASRESEDGVSPPRWTAAVDRWTGKTKDKAAGMWRKVKKAGEDDPRRITHSMKVGLALTVASVVYYVNPLYNGFGVSTVWALLTVVFVMEFTVGGTLSKGLNRSLATLVAGALGVGVHYVALLAGEKGEPFLLGCFVFVLGASATFSRFIPEVKVKFDYGVLIFILTFSLVAVSSYRADDTIELAHQRLSTIVIGGVSCMAISVVLFPVWAGEDLHAMVAQNLEKLATYLEGAIAGLTSEYLDEGGGRDSGEAAASKSFLQAYKSVLNTKATEEYLANLARWEPAHGRFRFRHPWKQYLKVGALARQCACCMEALNSHITKSEIQASSGWHKQIREACREMCSESSKALRELGMTIRAMVRPSGAADLHVAAACTAADDIKTIILEHGCLSEIVHAASITSILTEIVSCTQIIAKSVEELTRLANFETTTSLPKATAVNPVSDEEGSAHVSITVQK